MSDSTQPAALHPVRRKLRRRIGVRVVIASLLGSMVISALMSVLQIYYTYRQSIESAEQRFLQIEAGYLPSLAGNLWDVNQLGVDALLDGIAILPDVGRVELIDEMQQVNVRNDDAGEAVDTREFTLRYRQNDANYDVGILRVDLTDRQIMAQLKSRAIEIGAMIFIALFVNSMVVLTLLYRLIMRHVNSIARFASTVDVSSIGMPLALQRTPRKTDASDELDQVVDALNAMQRRLREELARRAAVEHDLRQHHENLEALITERTLAYNASAAQLEIAADVAELGIWSMVIKTGTMTWNQRMFDIYCVPQAERDGDDAPRRWWNARVHPEDIERTVAALRHAIATQTLYTDQLRLVDDNGFVRHVRARAQVVYAADGRPVTMTGINYDITEQIEIENFLTRAKEDAEAGARVKAEFLAAMSHEIRTPMNGVLGMLNLLLRTDLNQEQRRRMLIARNSADHLLTVINDILDFSKIDAGKMTIDAIDFDLVQQIGDSVQSLSLRAQEKGLELVADVTALDVAWVRGDPGRLRQILVNLIGNAIKFTERGEVVVRCQQHVQGEVIYLSVSISDTGIGIAAEKIESLFAAFSQVDASMTRRFGGTGLGLVISKKLCQLMGGDISVASTVGEGSCFTFDILLAPARTETAPRTQPDLQGLDILVIDDNDTSRDLLGYELTTCSAAVTLAASAQEALRICERQSRSGAHVFDIVIVDMDMPDMNGVEFGLSLVDDPRWSQLKLILMTNMAPPDDVLHAASRIFSAFMPKPVMPVELCNCIAQVLSNDTARSAFFPVQSLGLESNPSSQANASLWPGDARVLLVEDNVVNQDVASLMLSDFGLSADIAGNGREAIDRLRAAMPPYTLVLMDCQMPEMDGFAASRAIRNAEAGDANRNVAIIALTANAMTGDRERCLQAGMNDYLAKPLDDKALFDKLQQWLLHDGVAAESVAAVVDNANEAPAETPVWDEAAVLRSLKGRRDRLETLINLFRHGLPEQLASLERSLAALDFEKTAHYAHTIKGSSSQLRAMQVWDLASALEAAARERQFDACEYYSALLVPACDALLEVLGTFVGGVDS